MKSLLQLSRIIIISNKVKNFNRLKLADKILIFKAFLLTAIMRGVILIVPFKYLRKYMGKMNKESSINLSDDEYIIARRISWSINKVSRFTPWESKCLVQAMTAQYLLSRAHIENTLYLGVSKKYNNEYAKGGKESNLVAHSWIRCGNYYVTGGDGKKFRIVAKFSR